MLGGFLLFAGAQPAKANGWDDDNRRLASTEMHLQEAIERHGFYSRQANHWRHEQREAYERIERDRRKWRERERREHRRDHDDRYDRRRDYNDRYDRR
jgi:hypothetical protein